MFATAHTFVRHRTDRRGVLNQSKLEPCFVDGLDGLKKRYSLEKLHLPNHRQPHGAHSYSTNSVLALWPLDELMGVIQQFIDARRDGGLLHAELIRQLADTPIPAGGCNESQ